MSGEKVYDVPAEFARARFAPGRRQQFEQAYAPVRAWFRGNFR